MSKQLLSNYLTNRKQCELLDIAKDVPQGSILDPILFNTFVNDLFHKCELYNYADDNTWSKSDKS